MNRDRELLEEINRRLYNLEILMTANDTALAALVTAVSDNTVATNAAVAALGLDGSDDISAGVTAQATQIAANTAALQAAITPPATTTPPASSTPAEGTPVEAPVTDTPTPPLSPTEAAIANEAAAAAPPVEDSGSTPAG